ncbi:MAG: hypothetical protein WCK82_08320 [Bacteroidota bacterium]
MTDSGSSGFIYYDTFEKFRSAFEDIDKPWEAKRKEAEALAKRPGEEKTTLLEANPIVVSLRAWNELTYLVSRFEGWEPWGKFQWEAEDTTEVIDGVLSPSLAGMDKVGLRASFSGKGVYVEETKFRSAVETYHLLKEFYPCVETGKRKTKEQEEIDLEGGRKARAEEITGQQVISYKLWQYLVEKKEWRGAGPYSYYPDGNGKPSMTVLAKDGRISITDSAGEYTSTFADFKKWFDTFPNPATPRAGVKPTETKPVIPPESIALQELKEGIEDAKVGLPVNAVMFLHELAFYLEAVSGVITDIGVSRDKIAETLAKRAKVVKKYYLASLANVDHPEVKENITAAVVSASKDLPKFIEETKREISGSAFKPATNYKYNPPHRNGRGGWDGYE